MDDCSEKFEATHSEWKKFLGGVPIDDSTIIPEKILNSWQRCREEGVDPYLKKVPVVLDGNRLRKRLEDNKEFIDASLPFIENLYTFVKGSGFTVVLFDSEAYILKIIGDEDIKASAEQGNLIVGSCWSEDVAGTNGGGTVLALDEPIQIFASEHYCITAHKWTCSGAPIHNHKGKLIGGIDMTGPYHRANPHTLGMVVAAAHAIENHLRVIKSFGECQVANTFKDTVIESVTDALITINTNGIITLVNQNAKKMLNFSSDMILGRKINEIWGDSKNKDLLSLVNSDQAIIDAEVKIFLQNKYREYTITCNPILSPQKNVIGKIITLNEIKRAKALVTRMTGAKANLRFENIIGDNPRFLNTVKLAKIASESDSTVLLLGETGTGKDLFAQAIHNESSRKNGPYVAINCAAIPRDLISSELFGYSEGAFTGSKRGGNPGKFELADGGTIFLDEIAEMPLELQTILLRVIQEKTITRIGGKGVISLDVRIIAATNKNLREEVKKRGFREDLYYRINVFTIEMVPLRERKSDIRIFVDKFIEDLSKKLNKKIDRMDDRILGTFLNYTWPGNVRELQNVIERMINIAPANEFTLDLLPLDILHSQQNSEDDYEIIPVEEMERRMILKMLRANFPKNEIAKKLNISRNTLYRRLEKYGLS